MNPGFVMASADSPTCGAIVIASADNPTYGAIVIASAAWQSMASVAAHHHGLPRRVAPRSDDAGAVIAICLCRPTKTAYGP